MIAIYVWNRTERKAQKLEAAVLSSQREALLAADKVVWIDLQTPTPDEEALVLQSFFPIHVLSLEDTTRLRREPEAQPNLPKVEEFPDYLFVIVNPLTTAFLQEIHNLGNPSSDVKPHTQLSAILTEHLLITHHCEPMPCIADLQLYLQRHETQGDRGPDYLFHLILDSTVDQYIPVLDHIDDHLDEMETQILEYPQPAQFQKLLRLKREIIRLRKTLIYEREVLVRLARGEFELVDERETIYYRNVYDHLVRFTELIESSREMATDLSQSYLASTSNRLNQIMKVLAMISTIILPMSLIASVYGMNFEVLPELKWPWGYPFALGLMAVSATVSLAFFVWKKWL